MRIGTFLPGLDLDTVRFECQLPETIVSAAERTDKRTASKAGPGACLAARGRNRGRSIRALLAPWIVAVTVLFTASADEAAAHTGAGAGANDPVNIPDANLRARVEAALGKASGETITHAEMAGLTTCRRTNMPGCLNTQGAYADRNNVARAITDLTGLEHATGLTRLVLSNNPIMNLAPIAGLTSLTELTLARGRVSVLTPIAGLTNLERLHLSNNQIDSSQLRHLTGLSSLKRLSLSGNRITSLTSLSGLTGLTHLSLYRNRISNLSPLSGLTNLIDLLLDYNDITDIEPLRQMTALSLLRLEGNHELSDISPLSGLTSLSRLDLDVTSVVNIKPLVDNPGLASGDTIDLRDTPHLNAAAAGHALTLEGRGVTVVTNTVFTNENRWVQNVLVTSEVRQLTVTWDSLTDYNPQGYKVQWRSGDQDYSDTASPARHHIVSGAGTTNYTIPDLIPGTEYTVRIRADNGDDYGGPPSAEATGTPLAPQPPPPPPPDDPVPGVTVTPGKVIYAMETLGDGRAITHNDERYYTLSGQGGVLTFRVAGDLVIPVTSPTSDRRIRVTITLSNMLFTTNGAKALTVWNGDTIFTDAELGNVTQISGGRDRDNRVVFLIDDGSAAYTQDTILQLSLGEVQMKLGAPGSVVFEIERTDGVTSGINLVGGGELRGAVDIEPVVTSVEAIPTPLPTVIAEVAHGFERFRPSSLKDSVGGVDVKLKEGLRSAIGGQVITELDQVFSGELSRVGFSGDTTFLEAAFLDSTSACTGTNTTNVLTADNEWKTGRDRIQVTEVDEKYLCLEVDGETEIPVTDAYRAAVDFVGIQGAAFPPADREVVLAGIGRNGSTVRIPYLTTFSGYNQRIVMRNRWNDAVPYTITFHPEPGITVDPSSVERVVEPGTTMTRVIDLLGGEDAPVTITGGSRTAATIVINISPTALDVATVLVNQSTGGTDTVIHEVTGD